MAKLSRAIAQVNERIDRHEAMLRYLIGDELADFEASLSPVPPPDRAILKGMAAAKPAAEGTGEIDATQGAKDLAAEHGVDLASVAGSGSGGKVTKADVEAALAAQG